MPNERARSGGSGKNKSISVIPNFDLVMTKWKTGAVQRPLKHVLILRQHMENYFWLILHTRIRPIFARDILLYYSYVQSYVALAQKLFWFTSCHHGVERRRPLSWAVVVVCPRPSTSPWPWHHGRRGDMLGQGHTTTTAGENWRWWYPIFSWLF